MTTRRSFLRGAVATSALMAVPAWTLALPLRPKLITLGPSPYWTEVLEGLDTTDAEVTVLAGDYEGEEVRLINKASLLLNCQPGVRFNTSFTTRHCGLIRVNGAQFLNEPGNTRNVWDCTSSYVDLLECSAVGTGRGRLFLGRGRSGVQLSAQKQDNLYDFSGSAAPAVIDNEDGSSTVLRGNTGAGGAIISRVLIKSGPYATQAIAAKTGEIYYRNFLMEGHGMPLKTNYGAWFSRGANGVIISDAANVPTGFRGYRTAVYAHGGSVIASRGPMTMLDCDKGYEEDGGDIKYSGTVFTNTPIRHSADASYIEVQ